MVRGRKATDAGQFAFNARQHDDDATIILGETLPAGGGQQDGERVLDILARNPNCATFISTKLVRRFIADQPPTHAVQLGAGAFSKSDGDIKATLGTILHSEDFKQSFGQKIKRPFELVASALRALDADTDGGAPLQALLMQMGQPLFLWQSPNGYPDTSGAWTGAGSMLARWTFGQAIGGNALRGTHVDISAFVPQSPTDTANELSRRLFGPTLPADVHQMLQPFAGEMPRLLALLVAAPLFQMRG